MCVLAINAVVGSTLRPVRAIRVLFAGAVLMSLASPVVAFPIRVSTATELTLNPTVSADRRGLRLAVLLRDDRRAAVEGRTLTISVASSDGLTILRDERTDTNGSCLVDAHLSPQVGRVTIDARFAGDDRFAPATTRADLELDAPFVTVELSAPTGPLSIGEVPPPFNVAVNTGNAAWLAPGDLAVDLVAVEGGQARVLAAGISDPGGRVLLTLSPGAFPHAGIYELRPRVEVRPGRLVDGIGRTVLVRSGTVLTAAVVSEPDAPRARLRGRLRTASDAPLAGAPIRLMRGDETVSATRTDAVGEFFFEVDLDRSALSGSVVRAQFDPADPWFMASTSSGLTLGSVPTPPIHWAWMVAPWGLLAFAVFALTRRKNEVAVAPVVAGPADVVRDAVIRLGEATEGGIQLTVAAFDRSTGAALPAATYRSLDEADGVVRGALESMVLERSQRLKLVVSAEGFEPRNVEVARLAAGRHCVRVGLLGWREAVFDRVRPALLAAADGPVLPTPREAVGTRSDQNSIAPWAAVVERGAYGPEAPDVRTVRVVERALGGEEVTANDASVAVDAVN